MRIASVLGDPAIQLGALRIWVHGYEYPESTDEWGGNWLRVTARCAASGASVEVSGSILETVGFLRFQQELAVVYQQLQGVATLESHDPELKVEVLPRGQPGQLEVRVRITPDHLNQEHRFVFRLDQSYLPEVMQGCARLLAQYPVRGLRVSGA